MPRLCQFCKHWGRHFFRYPQEGDAALRVCESASTHDVSEWDRDRVNALPRSALVSTDAECYGSTIATGPDFGCVNFEPGGDTGGVQYTTLADVTHG